MRSQHMFWLKLSITIFLTILTFPTSTCSHKNYTECSRLVSCAKFSNIGYPFWGFGGLRPEYCGHPDFKLECPKSNLSADYPTLYLFRDEYQVTYMKTNYSITLKLQSHDPKSSNCLYLAINSLAKRRFDNGSIVLFKCLHPIDSDNDDHYSCSDDHGLTYYRPQNLPVGDSHYQFCTFIQISVSSGDGAGEDMLKNGFEMSFSEENIMCIACETSGGMCVSSGYDSPFLCYCKDKNQTFAAVCPKSGKLRKHLLEIVLPVGSFFTLALLLVGLFCYKKRSLRSATLLSRTSYDGMRSDLEIGNSFVGIPVFPYNELREATNNFDPDRVLGDGGFGIVYHGKLKDGREVAVKRLYERNYKRVREFRNEVEILTKLKHPNLVKLYGCTSRHSRELLLVYEYIPNGTVADHLYGDRSDFTSLTWTIRMKIAVQTAEALSYLHASEIIHRDVKTNNILLDTNFSVKVADFGLSRLFPMDASHVSTAPQGTPGYLDPEYRKCYQVTSKSDVYSFGVVLTELISSLPAIDIKRDESEINLSTLAINKIQQGALDELVDRNLGFESNFKVKRMVTLVAELAFQCLQQEKEVRPSMEEVLEALKGIESLDYEALEAQEMSQGFMISKPASGEPESGVEQPLRKA